MLMQFICKLVIIFVSDYILTISATASHLMRLLAGEFTFTVNFNSPRFLLGHSNSNYYRFGIIVNLTCSSNSEFLKLAATEDLFNISYEWLIWMPNEEYISLLEGTRILSVSSEVTIAIAGTDLYDVYQHGVNSKLIIKKVGIWSNDKGLDYYREPRKYDFARESIYGGIFFIQDVFDHTNLSAQLQDSSFSSNKDIVNRYFYALNLHIADYYNFTLRLVEAESWGDLQPNGRYSGLIGQLQSKVINISVGPLLMLPVRAKLSDFMPQMMEYWMPFAFRQPRALGTYRALALPLMPTAWLAILITLLFGTIMFHYARTNDGQILSFGESFLQFISIFAQQGLVKDPGTFSGRLICLTMLLMAALVMLYYNASTMTALLSSTPPTINKLDQLVSSNIPLTLMNAPYFNNKEARSRVLNQATINKAEKYFQRTFSLQEGLNIVLKGGAFCAEFFTIYEGIDKTFKDSQKCDLTYIPALRPFLIASLLQKNSHLRDIFKRGFIRLMEHGLSKREKDKWIVRKPKCTGKQQFIFVSLEAITIAWGTLAIGTIICLLILLAEIITKIKEKRRIKRNSKPPESPVPFLLPIIN